MNNSTGILEMTITKEIEAIMKDYPFFLELEMMQGEKQLMSDGRTKYTLNIEDQTKCDVIKEFILKFMSNSHNSCKN